MPEYIYDNSRTCVRFQRGDILGIVLSDGGCLCRRYLIDTVIDPQTRPQRGSNAHTKNSGKNVWHMKKDVSSPSKTLNSY